MIEIHINGSSLKVREGTTVAAAVLSTRTPFAPLCGMGTCYQCRVNVNGEAHTKSCQLLCQPGMKVTTNAL